MKLALVYDRVNKFGGAEQVLLGMHEVWKSAPLFTAFYSKTDASWADRFEVKASFANSLPFASRHHELYPWLAPSAFESFSFDGYDCVLSVTSAEAKSVITKPDTCHICYCLTPTRYLWSGYEQYKNHPGLGNFGSIASGVLTTFLPTLRHWDKISSARPDFYIAISNLVKRRIEEYYEREVSDIIHPPVHTEIFVPAKEKRPSYLPSEYYLVVSRFVSYKRLDLLIKACNTLKRPLVVVGNGHELSYLRSIAGNTIYFVNEKLTDERLAEYYQHCIAFLYAAEEDFGIVAAEAQSCGKPVIAYKNSGVEDIVTEKTGVLFEDQSVRVIMEAIRWFETKSFDASQCRSQALQFSYTVFQQKIKNFVEKKVKNYSL